MRIRKPRGGRDFCLTLPRDPAPQLHRVMGWPFGAILSASQATLVDQTVKRLSAMQETWVWSLGRKDPLEKEMATHSSTLGWKIPWKEEPGWLQSTGSQRVGHDRATSLHFLSLFYLRWKHFVSLSLLPSAPPPIHPVFDMNSSLCLGPVDFLPWLHLETIQISSPDRTETKSEGSWKKTMRHKKRMKKFPITVSSKILPLWGDPLGNMHTHTPRVFSIIL